MTIQSPIKYTSRDYYSVMNDINADPDLSGTPEWWKRIMAGCVDTASMMEDVIANNFNLRTAFTTQAVRDLLKELDYEMTPYSTSSGTLLFYIKRNASFPQSFAKTDLVALSPGTNAISQKRFEARAGQTIQSFSETFTANATTDKLTVARTDGYYLGDLIRVTTSSELPSPLVAGVDYYVIPVNSTTIRLATNLPNAFNGTYIDITSAGTGTQTLSLYSFPVTVYQQQTIAETIIGSSDGVTAWQQFNIPFPYFLRDQAIVTINGETWTRVDDFINSSPLDRVYKIVYQDNNYSAIEFGNGVYGFIPAPGDILLDGCYGGGRGSNISVLNKINAYAGTNQYISGVTNTTTTTGGAETEGIESAKMTAPSSIKNNLRFITTDDGETLIRNYGAIAKSEIDRNYYGSGTVRILYVPNGGGVLTASESTALNAYLTALTVLQSIVITIVDPTYTDTNYISSIKILLGYTYDYVQPIYDLGIHLALSAQTTELKQMLLSQGIAVTVAYINVLWGYNFDSTYYATITAMLTAAKPVDFAGVTYQSDVDAITTVIPGLDYSIPTTTFPITAADAHILEVGTVTTTEII